MGKIVNLNEYRNKQLEKSTVDIMSSRDLPRIFITKAGNSQYNIIVSDSGENTLFNQRPIPNLAVAIYAASYCKDKLSEYLDEFLSTDIIVFDEECTKEMNMEQ